MMRPVEEIVQISPRPVLIIHGEADQTVPLKMSLQLYDAAGEPRELWTEPDVSHANMLSAHPDAYQKRVLDFFANYLFVDHGY